MLTPAARRDKKDRKMFNDNGASLPVHLHTLLHSITHTAHTPALKYTHCTNSCTHMHTLHTLLHSHTHTHAPVPSPPCVHLNSIMHTRLVLPQVWTSSQSSLVCHSHHWFVTVITGLPLSSLFCHCHHCHHCLATVATVITVLPQVWTSSLPCIEWSA